MTKFIFNLVAIVLAIDVFGFALWVASGQTPVDNFHVGVITKTVLSFFI